VIPMDAGSRERKPPEREGPGDGEGSRRGTGKAPGRQKPRRARTQSETGKPIGCSPNRPRDETPEARPERVKARPAGEHRTRGDPHRGRRRGKANRRRGRGRREATRSRSGHALKGKPHGRARLKHIGEIAGGARRRSGPEPQGRNMTRGVEAPGMVAPDDWVASKGKRPRGSGAQETRRKAVIVRGNARVKLRSEAEACGRDSNRVKPGEPRASRPQGGPTTKRGAPNQYGARARGSTSRGRQSHGRRPGRGDA